mmetsp:Transcript_31597/g.89708  ORF Transcript_31597/g.89708 Transcript_31597/m.89708 type:complete len:582 (+) Transcript_31597:293-2038(+)
MPVSGPGPVAEGAETSKSGSASGHPTTSPNQRTALAVQNGVASKDIRHRTRGGEGRKVPSDAARGKEAPVVAVVGDVNAAATFLEDVLGFARQQQHQGWRSVGDDSRGTLNGTPGPASPDLSGSSDDEDQPCLCMTDPVAEGWQGRAAPVLLVPHKSTTAVLPFLQSHPSQVILTVLCKDLDQVMERVDSLAPSRRASVLAPPVAVSVGSGSRVAYIGGPPGSCLVVQAHDGASYMDLARSMTVPHHTSNGSSHSSISPGSAADPLPLTKESTENDREILAAGPPPRFPTLSTTWAEWQGTSPAPVVINSRRPISIRTELFEGSVLLMLRPETPQDDSYYQRRIFDGRKRMFECQVQGRFLKQPKGMVYIGAEITKKMEARHSFCPLLPLNPRRPSHAHSSHVSCPALPSLYPGVLPRLPAAPWPSCPSEPFCGSLPHCISLPRCMFLIHPSLPFFASPICPPLPSSLPRSYFPPLYQPHALPNPCPRTSMPLNLPLQCLSAFIESYKMASTPNLPTLAACHPCHPLSPAFPSPCPVTNAYNPTPPRSPFPVPPLGVTVCPPPSLSSASLPSFLFTSASSA